MSTPSTSSAGNEGPFTLMPPASPQDGPWHGGPQGDFPAGAVETVFLVRRRRISGPKDLGLLVAATPNGRGGACVHIELRDLENPLERGVSFRVPASQLIADDEFGYANPQWSELILARLCEYANQLYRDRVALLAGEAFLSETVDYSDPENGIALLVDRGGQIHDEPAIRRLLEADPGTTYYGNLDLDAEGHDWDHGGGRWIDRIESQARQAGGLT